MKFSLGMVVAAGILLSGCSKSSDDVKKSEKPAKPPLAKLNIIDIEKGTGDILKKNDRATVFYRGELADGTVFESNYGKTAAAFVVADHQVIDGWVQGLQGMRVGGKRRLEIPFGLAYGVNGSGKIPPKADLYFEVQLSGVEKAEDQGKVIVTAIKDGSGLFIKAGDKVTVHSVFKLSSGRLIQDSHKKGGPYTFTVGNEDEIIASVDAAVRKMQEGGKYEVKLPPGLGPQKGIPDATPSDTWIVELEILKVVRV